MAAISLTYTLTNGTTADATQVMQDFSDIVNGTSDGTKDFSISALTCAGTATLNGHVNLGNSTADDLTITASLASTLAIKTNTTYNIGSATLGLLGIYIGGTSTYTTRLIGAATASYTITLPPDVPAGADYVMKFSASGVATFTHPGPLGAAGSDADTTLTLSSNRIQVVTPTADRAYTLPTTGVKAGDEFHFINNAASTVAFVINVKSSGGNQVLTIYPNTSNSVVALQDTPTTAAHWMGKSTVVSHWLADSSIVTPNNFGTVSTTFYRWRRNAGVLEVDGYFTSGTPAAATASLTVGKTIESAKLGSGTSKQIAGRYHRLNSAGPVDTYQAAYGGVIFYDGSDTAKLYIAAAIGSAVYTKNNADNLFTSGHVLNFQFSVPISGWGPCSG